MLGPPAVAVSVTTALLLVGAACRGGGAEDEGGDHARGACGAEELRPAVRGEGAHAPNPSAGVARGRCQTVIGVLGSRGKRPAYHRRMPRWIARAFVVG